jgi:tetratricopeptide (TPR) repeat protein
MWVSAAIALGAIAVWPSYVRNGADAAHAASLPTPAPVVADYADRDKLVAFWERAVGQHFRGDTISASHLSAQYMQRYRERGDIGDVVRAMHAAQAALRAHPRNNLAAEVALGSSLVALHRFKDALIVIRYIERYDRNDPSMLIREASVDLELGRYDDAKRIIDVLERSRDAGAQRADAIPLDTLVARYDELTGHLSRARERFERATAYANAQFDAGAQQRAWFYFRAGELAFEAGDNDTAIADERRALDVFPNYSEANRMLARFACSLHRWQECRDAAEASARVVPYPEVLGYQADAQRALGDAAGAAQTSDLIRTIERIGNAQHVSDRLLAIYYSDHDQDLGDAYRIAKGELAVRDDIFTEDTLAWAAAMDGRWDEARAHIAKALRFDTENSLLQYHAGIIAFHFGDRGDAKRRLGKALALNPQFHPVYADEARARLARL